MNPTLETRPPLSIPLAHDEVAQAGEILGAGGAAVEVARMPGTRASAASPARVSSTAMHLVGVIEIVAGVFVFLKPRYRAYVVAAWLAGIILDLLTYSGYYDVALRDFGLLLGALTLARLASVYDPPGAEVRF
jgi:hypothetical protein